MGLKPLQVDYLIYLGWSQEWATYGGFQMACHNIFELSTDLMTMCSPKVKYTD